VLCAIATHPARARIRLDIYGNIAIEEPIRETISGLNLQENVRLHGFVDDKQLDAALALADLAINLRHPSMGEASGTQLRIWSHGLPSLVTRTGWFEEQSDDLLAFVRPDHEVEDLHAHFDNYLHNPDPWRIMGIRARSYMARTHSVENYAARLLEFIADARDFRTKAAALHLLHDIIPDIRRCKFRGAQ
jgi:glycosyltransferase involved in cell wall biosynthesis